MNTTDLAQWMMARLAACEGCRAPLYRLHNDFCLWACRNNAAPLRLDPFRAQLLSAGMTIEGHMVRGFCLEEDLPGEAPAAVDVFEVPLEKGRITSTQWLEDLLRQGPQTTTTIRSASWLAHFSWPTMLRAKEKLDVHSRSPGVWELPSS